MKSTKKLPASVRNYLADAYKEETVKGFAECDLGETGGFETGFLILTGEKLLYVVTATETVRFHRLGGNYLEYDDAGEVIGAKEYRIRDIKDPEIVPEVARHYLVVTVGDRKEKVCFFSGTARKNVYSLIKELKKTLDPSFDETEEPEEEDELHCPICGTLYPDPEERICPKCMKKSSVFFRMLRYMKPYAGRLILLGVTYVVLAVLNLVYPYLSGTILYDRILAKDESFLQFIDVPGNRFLVLLGMTVLFMIAARLLRHLLNLMQGVIVAKLVPKVVYTMKTEVFRSMGKMELHFFTSNKTGSLMTRVLDDANRVTSLFIDGLPYFLIDSLSIIAMFIVMLRLNAWLALIVFTVMPLITFFSFRMMPGLQRVNTRTHQATRKLNSHVHDNIAGARVVKAFGKEKSEDRHFVSYNDNVRNVALEMAGYDNRFYISYMFFKRLAQILVWTVGGYFVLYTTSLELGVLVTFIGYINQLDDPLDYFSHLFRWFSRSMNSAERIFEIIDAVPKIREKADPYRPERIAGGIELKRVTFGYDPGKPILKDVSFTVPACSTLGIVGKSGAGKTTLVNLLSRLYDPDEGEVKIDGVNVKEYGFKELRKAVAMVSQETYIFSGTIAENIAYAKPDATKEEIVAAAMKAGAHDFICRTPDGYDTIVGAEGRDLSGGEKQRVSIARAILSDPRILILDEATSAVDTETELTIQRSIESLSEGRTTIMIAHRLSTLRNVDALIVLEDGRITERGTHEELIRAEGEFYRLMKMQTDALSLRIND